MRESGPSAGHRGLLLVLRAAAVLIVATGVNDVIAGAVKSYEPLYVYLGAVALVVWLDGALLGSIIALTSAALYALLFLPRPADPRLLLGPAMALTGVVIVVGVLRAVVRARRRPPAYEEIFEVEATPLLAPPPPPAPDMSEVLGAIAELRAAIEQRELPAAPPPPAPEPSLQTLQLVAQARGQAERERALREQLQKSLDAAHQETASAIGRITDLELAASEAERASREQIATLRRQLDLERARAEGETALRGHLEVELTAERQRAVSAIAERATLTSRVAELAASRAADETRTKAEAEASSRRVAELTASLAEKEAETKAGAEAARGRIAELEAALAAQVSEEARTKAEAEASRRRIAELEASLAAAAAVAEETARAKAEIEASNARLAELEASLASLTAEEVKAKAAIEASSGRIAELEALLGEVGERTKAEVDASRARIVELETALTAERERADAAIAAERENLSKLEAVLSSEREAANAALANERERIAAEFDERLQTIVNHLAADHETDLGKAVEEREEARAEARSLGLRLSNLQRKVEEERQTVLAKVREADEKHRHLLEDSTQLLAETRAAAEKEIAGLRRRVEELERAQSALPTAAVPASAAPPATAPIPATMAMPATLAMHTAADVRPRVLIAHPDADLRAAARASLERAGYEIVSAADGLEALRTAIAQRPAVVIADAIMPKMDGRELCQLLKSQEKTAHIRVILLARAGDDRSKGDLPPDEVLQKPVPLETLKAKLAALIG